MISRIVGSIVVLISILVFPFWIYISILLVAIVIFPFYVEGILFGFLIDVIYGSGVEVLPSVVSPFALSILVLLIVMLPIKERIRLYV